MIPRYPGAPPFADDDTSRLVFCGRDADSVALLNLVLAHRLVVVYAKSGLGKTSLLQAGLAQRLRDENCLPLMARLNNTHRLPLVSIVESVALEAKRQGIEHSATPTSSLWHYFKTVELWRRDSLMTPVLVLDQFEEIFTLQSQQARAAFLADLGFLVRGVRPSKSDSSQIAEQLTLSDRAPNVRVVISLREEFLGLLEEAADDIPQILDHRYRLKPLDATGAAEAIAKPAATLDARFGTRPFRYAPGTIDAIIEALVSAQQANPAIARSQGHIEPFHLQLICHRAEEIAAGRQKAARGPDAAVQDVIVSFEDLGGVPGFQTTFKDFYLGVVRSFASETRRKIATLSADHLISPEGRRLSLEAAEIKRLLNLEPTTLRELVDRRLLRGDQRADGWYLELSHDTMVEPILSTRRWQSMFLGGLGLLASVTEGAVAAVFLVVGLFADVSFGAKLLGTPFVVLALWHASVGARRTVDSLNRYVPRTRRLTLWEGAICGYAFFVVAQWVYQLFDRGGLPAITGVNILQLSQSLLLISAAIALLGLDPSIPLTVSLLAGNLAVTIAIAFVRYDTDVQRAHGDFSSVLIASALSIGLATASLAYAWWLRKQRSAG